MVRQSVPNIEIAIQRGSQSSMHNIFRLRLEIVVHLFAVMVGPGNYSLHVHTCMCNILCRTLSAYRLSFLRLDVSNMLNMCMHIYIYIYIHREREREKDRERERERSPSLSLYTYIYIYIYTCTHIFLPGHPRLGVPQGGLPVSESVWD